MTYRIHWPLHGSRLSGLTVCGSVLDAVAWSIHPREVTCKHCLKAARQPAKGVKP